MCAGLRQVCVVINISLHSLYQGWPFYPARKDIFSVMENEYLRTFIGLVGYNMSRDNHIKMSAPELLCNSLCGPLPKILETYDLDRQSQPSRRGCHRWEQQNLPFAFHE